MSLLGTTFMREVILEGGESSQRDFTPIHARKVKMQLVIRREYGHSRWAFAYSEQHHAGGWTPYIDENLFLEPDESEGVVIEETRTWLRKPFFRMSNATYLDLSAQVEQKIKEIFVEKKASERKRPSHV